MTNPLEDGLMTQDYPHPITPPPELVQQWATEWMRPPGHQNVSRDTFMTNRAAQWGGDMELDACCDWVETECPGYGGPYEKLRAARRPEPPSLKEQAYAAIDKIERSGYPTDDLYTLRRALEQLDD